MRLRSALLAVAATASTLSVLLAGCGDGGAGGGDASDAGLVDTHLGDVAKDRRDGGPPPASARLTIVNAAHDLGPASVLGTTSAIRLCFLQGASPETLTVLPFPPLPDRVLPGTGATLAGIPSASGVMLPSIGLDFARRIVVPVIVNARSLLNLEDRAPGQPGATCDQLLGDTADARQGLVRNLDYWTLPPIEPGILASDHAYVVALTGCVGNAQTSNPGKCGPGFVRDEENIQPGVGNLKLTAYETSAAPLAAPFGAQLLYVSTQANAFFSQAGAKAAIRPGFFRDGVDGGAFRPITEPSPAPGALSAVVGVADVGASDRFVLGPKSLSPAEAAAGLPLLGSSLAEIKARSGLTSAPGEPSYPDGRNYVFIAVGDPDTNETKPFIKADGTPGTEGGAGSRFNNRFFHFLAYPADPPAVAP